MGLQKDPYTLGNNSQGTDTAKRPEPFSSTMSSTICCCYGSHFFVLFLGFGWWDHPRSDLLHQLGHSISSKQRDIKIVARLSNRPPQC